MSLLDGSASDEEVQYFLEFSMTALRRSSVFGVYDADWREKLMASVPRYFADRIEIERNRLAHPR